jgi:hypothetical protein
VDASRSDLYTGGERLEEFGLTCSLDIQPKLKRNTMWRCPRDHVDYTILRMVR